MVPRSVERKRIEDDIPVTCFERGKFMLVENT